MRNFFKSLSYNLILIILVYSCSSDDTEDTQTVPLEPVASQYALENDLKFIKVKIIN